MESIVATHPMELVHINYLCLEPGKGREENVLVVTDHLTWYAQTCYSIADGPENGQGIVGKFHCPLLTAIQDPFRPREKPSERTNH